MMHTVSLVEMEVGRECVVWQFAGGFGFTRRIQAMGIRLGTKLVKVSGSRFGGPVIVRAGNVQLALGHGMASKIAVQFETNAEGGRDA